MLAFLVVMSICLFLFMPFCRVTPRSFAVSVSTRDWLCTLCGYLTDFRLEGDQCVRLEISWNGVVMSI